MGRPASRARSRGRSRRVRERGSGRRALAASTSSTIPSARPIRAVRIVIGDLFEIELPPAYFDGVFASNLLEHFHSPEEVAAFLDRMRETLAPGRGARARWARTSSTARSDYFDCADHLLALTHVSVQELLFAAGYKVTEVVPRFLPFSFRSRLPASPALDPPLPADAGAVAAPGQAVPDPRDTRVATTDRANLSARRTRW